MTSITESAMYALFQHSFKCYKDNGFQIVIIKLNWHHESSLEVLTNDEVLDFNKNGWTIIEYIDIFENLPKIYYNDFAQCLIRHLESIDFYKI